ncbi:MAG: NMD3-related protein [Candidatus Thermoplasmatota archaeon]|jgi:nonsense-mediated mRNA decay protein 3|nr:NMD3-related protein [Candidatus Thermoplasmatota archaeon]
MFCVECGKETPIFRNGVCKSCFLKTHTFTKGPAYIDIPICVHCNSYKYKNTWSSELFDNALQRAIKNEFYINKELEKVSINTECKDTMDGKSCKIIISGFLDNEEIVEEHNVQVRLKRSVCDICSKRHGGYYEAIVQIRTTNIKLSKKELEDITKTVVVFVEDLHSKGNRGLFITDIGEEHGGLDFYISEKGAGFNIVKKIQEKYGGEIKKSSKDAGVKDSRHVHRMTFLIRLPSYKKNDFLILKNTCFMIISIHGNKIRLLDLSTWQELKIQGENLEEADIIGGKELIKEMIFVSQSENELQLMDPVTYETLEIRKPKPIFYNVEKIKVVKIDDKIFLVP